MKLIRAMLLVLGMAMVAAACGGSTAEPAGGSGPDVAATPAEVENACAMNCQGDQRCRGNTDTARCIEDCLEDSLGSVGRIIRGDALRAFSSCTEGLPCDGDDDVCEDAMYGVLGFTRKALREQPEVQACLAAGAKCSQNEDTISEFCTLQMVLVSSARSRFIACYAEPCETMLSCAKQVLYGGG